MTRNTLIAVLLALAGAAASGQTVWRCGNTYGTQPCAGGTLVDVGGGTANPTEAKRARQAAADDMKRADALEKARIAQEKEAPKGQVIGPKEAPPEPAKEKKDKKAKPQDPKVFTATGPKK